MGYQDLFLKSIWQYPWTCEHDKNTLVCDVLHLLHRPTQHGYSHAQETRVDQVDSAQWFAGMHLDPCLQTITRIQVDKNFDRHSFFPRRAKNDVLQ